MNNTNTPYDNLHPDLILNAIESAGFHCSGSLFALNSYENRVYQIGLEDAEPLIAKFYRPGRWSNEAILEEHQFSLELVEHEIPVVAPLIFSNKKTLGEFAGYRFAVFPRRGGRTVELDNLDHLEWMGRFIGRLHAISNCNTFKHRMTLDVASYGYKPYRFLIDNNFIPDSLKIDFCSTLEMLLEKIESLIKQVGPLQSIRLHGDCHAGNVLWNEAGPVIVDLDDCLRGPAVQDIWMLLTGDNLDQINLQLNTILRGYREFYDFNPRELHLIEALRTLRMIHYAAWLAKRWEDPAFPLNFPWFNTFNYWRELLQDLNDQVISLDQQDCSYL